MSSIHATMQASRTTADEPSAEEALAKLLARAEKAVVALDVREALKLVAAALAIARKSRDRRAMARAYAIGTRCHYYRGDVVAAAATGLDAYAAWPEPDQDGRSDSLQGVAVAFVAAGDFKLAERIARAALAEAAASRNRPHTGNSHNVLGIALAAEGKFEAAFREFRLARTLFRKLGDGERISAVAMNLALALRNCGIAAARRGDAALARRLWRRACAVYESILVRGRPRTGRILVQAALADCRMRLGDLEAGLASIADAASHLRSEDAPWIAAKVLWVRGELERLAGREADAARHLARALELAAPMAIDTVACDCLMSLSRLASARGDRAEARRLRQSLSHERGRREHLLAQFRREMRPLWDRHLRAHAA